MPTATQRQQAGARLSFFWQKTEVNLKQKKIFQRPARALSDGDRRDIRQYYMTHAVSVRELACEYGVSAATAWRAIASEC